MRALNIWTDKIDDKNGEKQCVYDMAFKPDGVQLVVAVGIRVLVYATADGDLVKSLKGHKDLVYCVAYARNGKHFASGGADKSVIIWNEELEGFLKFSHLDTIQCLAFNPVTHVLVTCSSTDFGFWHLEKQAVNKIKTPSRPCCVSWTNDGQYFAMGLFSGIVQIYNKNGEAKVVINRSGAPVWKLEWNPSSNGTDVLCVCDWNKNMSFYTLSGRQIGKDKALGYDPCALNHFSTGEFLAAGGSDNKVSLYTRDGVALGVVVETDSWVWCTAARPGQNYVAVGTQDGTIALYHVLFSTVHGIYKNRYAYRKSMTDVVVLDLQSNEEVTIKCRDLVKKIALYNDRLAVQLPNQLNVYDLSVNVSTNQLVSTLKAKIRKGIECNVLAVCSNHIILGQEKRVQSFTFDGQKEREWTMDSSIRYLKVVGGASGREGILLGLKSGLILTIFLDNGFPIELIKHQSAVRSVDMNSSRKKIAIIDENGNCNVYDLRTKALLYQEPNANSVAWNTQNEDMLCFSGNGVLNIKAADFPVHQQKLQGFIVGYNGSSIYCLHLYNMNVVDVPQSSAMYQYLSQKRYKEAYNVACLGVTDADWRALALDALEGLEFDVAKQSFIRVRDLRYLEIIHNLTAKASKIEKNTPEAEVLVGEIYAYEGKYVEAARIFVKANQVSKAVDMYCNLRQFDRAREIIPENDIESAKTLMKLQAEWCKTSNDPKLAIDILVAAREHGQAIELMGENGYSEELYDLGIELDKSEDELLGRIAYYLTKLKYQDQAAEILRKIGDVKGLVSLYITFHNWEPALDIVGRHNEYSSEVYLAYAHWLAENDKFEDAQTAFRTAGFEEKAVEVLASLTQNAVNEKRFDDAGFYYWQLSLGALQKLQKAALEKEGGEADPAVIADFKDSQEKANLYHAYDAIYRFIEEPFTSHSPEALFHIARYVAMAINKEVPLGISKASVLYALAKQSKALGAYKLARAAYEKLQKLKVPSGFREFIDLGSITIRSKPHSDNDDLSSNCPRCSAKNLILQGDGQSCNNCKHPFVFSSHTCEILPLVEFTLELDISDQEAVVLINNDDSVPDKSKGNGNSNNNNSDVQVLTFHSGQTQASGGDDVDSFNQKLMNWESGEPIRLTREELKVIPSSEVFIQKWPAPLGNRYYRNMLSSILSVSLCDICNRFFHTDDYELLVLQQKRCPFCRGTSPLLAIDGLGTVATQHKNTHSFA